MRSRAYYFCQINDQSLPEIVELETIKIANQWRMPKTKSYTDTYVKYTRNQSNHTSFRSMCFVDFSFKSTSVVMIIPDYYCYYELPICDIYAYYMLFDCDGKKRELKLRNKNRFSQRQWWASELIWLFLLFTFLYISNKCMCVVS